MLVQEIEDWNDVRPLFAVKVLRKGGDAAVWSSAFRRQAAELALYKGPRKRGTPNGEDDGDAALVVPPLGGERLGLALYKGPRKRGTTSGEAGATRRS